MRKIINLFCLSFVMLFAACQTDKPVEQQSANAVTENKTSAPNNSAKTLDVPWIAVYNDSTQFLEMKMNPAGNPENLNEQDIIDALNLKYPDIKLEALPREGNKAVVQIEDAVHLTSEMGSTGARSYLAEATYSLTEVEGIESVDFRFKQGDHAAPGILTRRSFENFN